MMTVYVKELSYIISQVEYYKIYVELHRECYKVLSVMQP